VPNEMKQCDFTEGKRRMKRWVDGDATYWIWFNDLNGLMLMGMS